MGGITVVMRSCNTVERLRETLPALLASAPADCELIVIDSESRDGSWEYLQSQPVRALQIRAAEYLPGAVLNLGASLGSGEFIVFLNDDATPRDPDFLERLCAPLRSGEADAVYARQIARPGAWLEVRRAYERAFPPEAPAQPPASKGPPSWNAFFSMVASATRREVWREYPLDPTLSFSEDIAWGESLRGGGQRVRYVPEAVVFHSHDYPLRASFGRFAGEGAADATLFFDTTPGLLRGVVSGLRAGLRDLVGALVAGDLRAVGRALPHAAVQQLGYRRGVRLARRGLWGRAASAPDFARLRAAVGKRTAPSELARDQLFNRLAQRFDGLRPELDQLLLVGSFGRGEGSMRRDDQGRWIPGNNIDLLAITRTRRGPRKLAGAILRIRAEILREDGVEVDVSLEARQRLRRAAPSQFLHDAGRGHRVLVGSARKPRAWAVPSLERLGTRAGLQLLLNRGVLLVANEELLGDGASEGRWRLGLRHATKGILGLGDAALFALARYDHRDAERRRRIASGELASLDPSGEFAALYEEAARLRACPRDGAVDRVRVRKLGRAARRCGAPLVGALIARHAGFDLEGPDAWALWLERARPLHRGLGLRHRLTAALRPSTRLRHRLLASLPLLLFAPDSPLLGRWWGTAPRQRFLRCWSRLEDPRLEEVLDEAACDEAAICPGLVG